MQCESKLDFFLNVSIVNARTRNLALFNCEDLKTDWTVQTSLKKCEIRSVFFTEIHGFKFSNSILLYRRRRYFFLFYRSRISNQIFWETRVYHTFCEIQYDVIEVLLPLAQCECAAAVVVLPPTICYRFSVTQSTLSRAKGAAEKSITGDGRHLLYHLLDLLFVAQLHCKNSTCEETHNF